ncbi:GLUG motif-containing protein, partial [Cloacibacillus evryensis]|uniref:GLUG motif-containing protein n=1 Tax=Cloacibacillus evryensis TaxID=508460 RepID=UPI003AB52590
PPRKGNCKLTQYNFFPLLLILITILTASPFFPGAKAAGANNTEELSYEQIGTKEELKSFRDRVNAGETTLNAKLTAKIDLENEGWTPIGDYSGAAKVYSGIFDGQGYTVSGFKIANANGQHQGLFGFISDAQIKNLSVSGSVSAAAYVGGIAGTAQKSQINNCTFTGDASGAMLVGGIVGWNFTGDVLNCAYYGGTVSVGGWGSGGGIVGYSQAYGANQATLPPEQSSVIANCIVSADIKASADSAGGIAGVSNYTTIANCSFIAGTVTSTANLVGGIAGSANNYQIISCVYAGGKITGGTGKTSIGGITGQANVHIYNCGWLEGSSEKAVGTANGSYDESNAKIFTAAEKEKIAVNVRLEPGEVNGTAKLVTYPGKPDAANVKIIAAEALDSAYKTVINNSVITLEGVSAERTGLSAKYSITPSKISNIAELSDEYTLTMDEASNALPGETLKKALAGQEIFITANATKVTEEIPIKPIIKSELPTFIDISKIPVSLDIDKAAAHTGISSESIELLSSGYTRVKPESAVNAVKSSLTGTEQIAGIPLTLPIFEVKLNTAGDTIAISILVKGKDLIKYGANASKLRLYKILSENKSLKMNYATELESLKDGDFSVFNIDGELFTGSFANDDTFYQICLIIKDNGDFDLNKDDAGVITDPVAFANITGSSDTPSSPHSGGGCSSGTFPAILLILAGAVMIGKKARL